jgi:CDP-archaeol synthase
MLQPEPVVEMLALLAVANGAPIAAKRLMGDRLSLPLDGGYVFFDGKPLLGPSKTLRGIVVAVAATIIAAILLGEHWTIGLVVALASMAGDLLSSFVKRRTGLAPSAKATGLDQIPEVLVPSLAGMPLIGLTWVDVAAIVLAFFAGAIVLSNVLYRVGFRDEPH